MPEPTLRVDVKLSPHPDQVPPDKLDELLEGELKGFQDWVMKTGNAVGKAPLSRPERVIVKSYLIYAATRGD